MTKSTAELRAWYERNFRRLGTNAGSRIVTDGLWKAWEEQGIARPDLDAVTHSIRARQDRFFREVVTHCGLFAERPNGVVSHCPLVLYDYNFRKITSSNGCLVLTDEAFERLLFVLSVGMMQLLIGDPSTADRERISEWLRTITRRWFIDMEEFSMPSGLGEILAGSYQATELGTYLFNGMYAFALAHEVGHHALGHGRGSTTLNVSPRDGGEGVPVDAQSHAEELEADLYALRVYMRLREIKDGANPLCFVWWFKFAPLVLFDICEVLEQAREIVRAAGTHPSPDVRRSALLRVDTLDSDLDLYRDLSVELRRVLLGGP